MGQLVFFFANSIIYRGKKLEEDDEVGRMDGWMDRRNEDLNLSRQAQWKN